MDSLSSSFISIFPQPNSTASHPQSLPPPFTIRVFSVRIEEKPQTVITTTTTRRPSGPKKPPTSPSNIKKRESSVVVADQSLPATIFNAFDSIINNFIDPPIKVSLDPKHVLSGNFSPVDELPPTECDVIEGTLPSCLEGVYIRNGPNPQFPPRGPYRLFDGDGMLHAISISNRKASLCSRYVKTYKYSIEKEAGFPIIPSLFSGLNGLTASAARIAVTAARVLAGQYDPTKGTGLANAGLAFFGNKLYALGESDLPYAIKLTSDGDIITIGRQDFDGKLFTSMSAHPKTDPVTKETFSFRHGPGTPFLTFFRFNDTGEKQSDVPIYSVTIPSFFHDFVITKNYAIFPEIQIGFSPMEVIGGGSPPANADPGKAPRLGLIPRYAKDDSEMKWFEVPGLNAIHCVNAWEEEGGDRVVMVTANTLSLENALERMDLIHVSMEKVTINVRTGMVSRHPLSTRNLDFAVINPAFVAVKNRFMYCGVGDPMPKFSGVVKLDVSLSDLDRCECIVASRMFEPGCFGGEPFFVAREPDNPNAHEDDGYLLSYVHNENTGESRFVVMDAKSPTLEIVAALKLPHRVPYGFHGLFVTKNDINNL